MTQPSAMIWTHALAALLFAVLALAQLRRPADGLPRVPFAAALTLTALWALAVAGLDGRDVAARIAEGLRNLAWLAVMWALARHAPARGMASAYAAVAATIVAAIGLTLAVAATNDPAVVTPLAAAHITLRMMAAMGAVLLVHRLWTAPGRAARGDIGLVALTLATLWLVDFTFFAAAWLSQGWPQWLAAVRGAAMAALVPPLWLAMQREDAHTLQISRTIAIQSFAALAVGFYIVFTSTAAGFLAGFGGTHSRLIQTAFVFGSAAALLTIASTPWLRAWAKVLVAKHLFRHRYDYRTEWLRFTGTIGVPDRATAPLGTRVVRAMADLVDAPAGLLLVPEAAGLAVAATWGGIDDDVPVGADLADLATYLLATRRTLELDAVRAGTASYDDITATPPAFAARADLWAVVPLVHFDALAGVVLLHRPPVERALDWEDFDLFGVAARQAASYLAEDRADTALAEARRFDEFNRRFAFILHDLKNLVSQQTLVARNAERHAENPAFRADMVATLRDSAERMNALLARLTQSPLPRGDGGGNAVLLAIAQRVATLRRAQHPVRVLGDATVIAHADPAVVEVLLGHLVQNAIEASDAESPVELVVGRTADRATITVVDHGCGMSAAFVRDQLFRPFGSSKSAGFGIGAYEARQHAEAMGGTMTVSTREREGSRFVVSLPLAEMKRLEQAA